MLACLLILNKKGILYPSGWFVWVNRNVHSCSLSSVWEEMAFFCCPCVFEAIVRHYTQGTCELRGESSETEFGKWNNCGKKVAKITVLHGEKALLALSMRTQTAYGKWRWYCKSFCVTSRPAPWEKSGSLVTDWCLTSMKKDPVLCMCSFLNVYVYTYMYIYK